MELEEYTTLLQSAELTDEQRAVLGDAKVTGLILPAIKNKLTAAYADSTNKTLTAVDNRIFETFGIAKQANEPSSEYYVRAAKEASAAQTTTLQSQLNELKAAKAGATPEELRILRESITKLEAEKAELAQKHKSDIGTIAFNTRFDRIKDKITFNPAYDAEILEPAIERTKAAAMETKTVEIDGVLYVTENGVSPLYFESKAVTLDDHIRKMLTKFEAKMGATGNGGDDSAGTGAIANTYGVKATTKTAAFEELEDTLKASGKNSDQIWAELTNFTASDFYKSLK